MGGGDTNYEAEQAKTEAKKQAARDALNVYFGTAPTTAPTVGGYTTTTTTRNLGGASDDPGSYGTTTTNVDQSGYDSALQAFNDQTAKAAANKTARDALYSTVRDDAYTAGKRGLDDTKTTAERQNKFALFAQGLNGGSEDIDQSSLLGRTYSNGLLKLGAEADTAKSKLATADEQTRLGLLQSIDAGMDQGSALSSALAQMKNNSDSAAASAQGTDLGDLFSSAGLLYTKSNAAQGQQAAQNYWANYFGTSAKPASSKGSSGIVTST